MPTDNRHPSTFASLVDQEIARIDRPEPPAVTDDQLRDLFARHCECRPLALERTEDDHAACHDCDTAILDDIQTALFSGCCEEAEVARHRCAIMIQAHARKDG